MALDFAPHFQLPPPPGQEVPTADVDPLMVARAGLAPAPTGGVVTDWSVERSIDLMTTRDVRRSYPHLGQRLMTKEVWDGQRWELTRYSIESTAGR